jgi:serine/threonine-protein kinase RsbW
MKKKRFLIPSNLSQVQKTSQKVLAFLKSAPLSKTCAFDIRLSLEEALINAMKYGHGLKKELKVALTVELGPKSVRITLEDQGKGFNPKRLVDCTQKSRLLKNCGRGIYLIYHLMDEVQYNSKGNRISMMKSFK